MKKNPVHTLNNQSDELFDFDIFSITSTESVYRVVHLLNSELAIDLEQADLLDFKLKNDEEFYFPLYSFLHPDLNLEFHLLPNQTTFQPPHHNKDNFDLFGGNVEQNARLISELENTDYFLLLKGENRVSHNYNVYTAIKSIKDFILVREIFLEDLADKKIKYNLLF